MNYLRRRRRTRSIQKEAAAWEYRNGEARLRTQLTHFGRESNPIMIFTFNDILLMTNNFSDILVIEVPGSLYKGTTLGGRSVVVKKPNSDRHHDYVQERFTNSIVVPSNMNHKNVVKLIGCCLETQLPIPVYDFSFNGDTLDDRMHHPESMSWKNRLRIAAEIADGLNYMHIGAPVPIIHRDIKPKNVILDETGTAKIIDNGLSVPLPLGETFVADNVMGTFGYLDPEYIDTGQVTEKSDVYSVGALLLHLLTGKDALFRSSDGEAKPLMQWFLSNVECGRLLEVVDVCIREEGSLEQFQAFTEIALRCTRGKGDERPAMKKVVLELHRIKRLITSS